MVSEFLTNLTSHTSTLTIGSMKHKLSVSLDEELVQKIMSSLSTGKFRNKSHVVEFAVKKLLEAEQNGK